MRKSVLLYGLLFGVSSIVGQEVASGLTTAATHAATTNAATTAQVASTATTAITTGATATTNAATTTAATSTVAATTTAAVTTTVSATTATSASATPSVSGCLGADPFSTTDYFSQKIDYSKLDSSAQFNVTYANTYKLVHNIALDEYYVLYCTSSAPSVGSSFESKTFIQIPVKSFAAVDTRVLGFLDLLGQSNNVAFVGDVKNVTSPCGTATPQVFNTSDPSFNRASYDLAIYPGSAANDPKGVGFGMGYGTSPLGNAQWVKYFSLFTNQESQAETIYNDISTDYNAFKESINTASHISYKRNVTFMNYDTSSTKFAIMQDQYFQNLTADAGAVLLSPTTPAPGDPSVMKGQLQNTSLVIDWTDPSAFNSTYAGWQSWLGFSASAISSGADSALNNFQTSSPYINSFDAPPIERYNEVWRLDLVSNKGAIDYWTRGFARPDLLLQDLIQAQYPDYFSSRSRVFMRSFATGESTKTAGASASYGCNLNSWTKSTLARTSYTNSTMDAPSLSGSSGNNLPLIIGVSVVGGMAALSCIATAIVMLVRRMKGGSRKRFTRLSDESAMDFENLDKDPIMMEESGDIRPSGRLGGSGRGL